MKSCTITFYMVYALLFVLAKTNIIQPNRNTSISNQKWVQNQQMNQNNLMMNNFANPNNQINMYNNPMMASNARALRVNGNFHPYPQFKPVQPLNILNKTQNNSQ